MMLIPFYLILRRSRFVKLQDKKIIADEADMIINGYSFTKKEEKVFVVNLEVLHRGILSQRDIRLIQNFIKKNYKEMYLTWRELSDNSFYEKQLLHLLCENSLLTRERMIEKTGGYQCKTLIIVHPQDLFSEKA